MSGRGLIGRRVKVGRFKRAVVAVGGPGEIKLDRPVDGLRWWNVDGVKFLREDFTEPDNSPISRRAHNL